MLNKVVSVQAFQVLTILLLVSTFFIPEMFAADHSPPWERDSISPTWDEIQPLRVLRINYDPNLSTEKNGQRLSEMLAEIIPGDRLLIGSGKYTFNRKVTLDLTGTKEAPISIEAADESNPPILTRNDARQNLLNIGEREPTRFLKLQTLELIGGSVSIRFGNCENVWLDKCELHHAEHGGITANTHNTSKLYITNNHLHHFESGTGEAMYLGANNSKAIMTNSVVARNHVHDCAGSQGDGIEIKQGSHHNWIVGNEIHDTKYPCLIAYGTDGNGINLIENNILYRSQNQTLQVQGEAIVRNNLIMAARGDGFSSTDHQGKTKNLTFVHNTIITTGRGANLSSWGNREGMVFANNAIYSRDNLAVRFPSGCDKVAIAGNVILGGVQGCSKKSGFTLGNGLNDFQSVDWTASKRNATPSKLSAIRSKADQNSQ